MKLILAGCEYSGTTTLAHAIFKWGEEEMGAEFGLFHDHYKIPHTSGHPPTDHLSELDDQEQEQLLALAPKIKEQIQRHSMYYHIQQFAFLEGREHEQGFYPDYLMIGLHIEDTIYGRLYFDYGHEGHPGDRSLVGPNIERAIMEYAPDLVLVHIKATSEVIKQRMKENPHTNGVLKEKDIDVVLKQFEEGFQSSLIQNKFEIDTSTATEEGTLQEFIDKMNPFLTKSDRNRRDRHQEKP